MNINTGLYDESKVIKSYLRVGSFNCQGIIEKMDDPMFLNSISKYDIFGVCETWLNKENESLNVPNYKFYPLSRKKEQEKGQSRGGVGWFIRESLRRYIKILYDISDENMFFCKLDKDFFNFNEDAYVGIIYFPPENSSREKRIKVDHFENLMDKVTKIDSNNIILVGDFNARTKDLSDTLGDDENDVSIPHLISSKVKYIRTNQDGKANRYGKKLVDFCMKTSSFIANGRTLGDLQGKFTCYAHNGTSTVDYAVISETMYTYITKFFVSTPKYKSDHCMLELEIKLPKYINIEKDDSKRQKPSLKWKRDNIELFKSQMESPSTMKLIKDIETYFSGNNNSITNDAILEKINFLYTYNSPKQKKHWDKKSKNHKKWYDVSCYEMNKKLKSIAKLNQKNPTNNEIRRNLNMVKKQYKKLLKDKKRKWSENIIRKIEKLQTEDPKQYWSLISELRNTPKNSNIIDKSKFELFYEKLFSKYSNEHNDIHNAIIKEVEETLSGNKDIIDKDFNMKEFKESLSKLNNSKTAGPDRIPAEMIKNSPDNVLKLILALINRIKNTDQYPKLWALGYTTLIHKDGDDDDPDNYRAITICSAMAKIFALMVKCRLDEVVVKNDIIGDYQIGFKKGSRPADHLFLLKGITDHYSQKRKKVYACFIDYRKAYDNVWREGLYYKLLKSGISPGIVKIIRSMNINTQQGLKINGTISNLFHSYRGVRQGCVLSPHLFNIFLNDLPAIFDHSCRPVKNGNMNI